MFRVILHIINGDSEDPIGDFNAIQQELALFSPLLAKKTQVVVINKIDLPHVRDSVPELVEELRRLSGHTRVFPVSAVTKENVKELMRRVRKLVASLPRQSEEELFTMEEDRVTFDEEEEDLNQYEGTGFIDRNRVEIITDPNFPGQFRVLGTRIEEVVARMNWDYYESVQRFQRILEAMGISERLAKEGAVEGDLVMIGDWDFNYWERKNRWIAELGLENINPRRRYAKSDD